MNQTALSNARPDANPYSGYHAWKGWNSLFTVTPEQASQISQAVKTVAMKLSKASGRNEYGGVYGELYRKFGITSYKQLPAAKFDEAISWMNEWRESIEGDSPF